MIWRSTVSIGGSMTAIEDEFTEGCCLLDTSGRVDFPIEPFITVINGMDFMDLLSNVWFTTDTIITLSNDLLMEAAVFTKSISTVSPYGKHEINVFYDLVRPVSPVRCDADLMI